MNKFLTMAQGVTADLDALKRERGRERHQAQLLAEMQETIVRMGAPQSSQVATSRTTLEAVKRLIPPVFGQRAEETFLGFPIVVDGAVPAGEIHLRDPRTGALLGRITNVR